MAGFLTEPGTCPGAIYIQFSPVGTELQGSHHPCWVGWVDVLVWYGFLCSCLVTPCFLKL